MSRNAEVALVILERTMGIEQELIDMITNE
jgi:hypothetical protein